MPLVFWGPGAVPAGRAPETLAGLVDVAPTLLDLAGFAVAPPAAPDEGRSLAASLAASTEAVAAGEPPASSAVEAAAERVVRFSGGNLYGLPAVLLEDDRWRFILRANGATELYDVAGDPLERHDRSADEPQLVERFRAVLAPRLELFLEYAAEEAATLDPEALKALKALGYVQ